MIGRLIESIRKRLKEKGVSLIMMFDIGGEILWSMGRDIKGDRIEKGSGFSKTACNLAIKNKEAVKLGGELVKISGDGLSDTAKSIMIKNILIYPLDEKRFFYVDTIEKEFTEDDIITIRESCYYLRECIKEVRRKSEEEIRGIRGLSDEIKERIIRYGKETSMPILITGETGSGKTYIAKLIHEISARPGKFIKVNVSSIPDNLFESELFGYRKGAFTGAEGDKRGLIEEAQGGTLLFDEITEIPFNVQSKLLHLVEEGTYRRLGESKERRCDVRFLFATNKDIGKSVKEKEFREDLYHRISTLLIEVPSIRGDKERIDEIIEEYKGLLKGKRLSKEAKEIIYSHKWRGNIRELKQVIIRLGIDGKEVIDGEDVISAIENHINRYEKSSEIKQTKINRIIKEIEGGKSFWESLWKKFIGREIDRDTMRTILKKYYEESGRSYKKMIKKLNIEEKDYKKFISLLHKYKTNIQ